MYEKGYLDVFGGTESKRRRERIEQTSKGEGVGQASVGAGLLRKKGGCDENDAQGIAGGVADGFYRFGLG